MDFPSPRPPDRTRVSPDATVVPRQAVLSSYDSILREDSPSPIPPDRIPVKPPGYPGGAARLDKKRGDSPARQDLPADVLQDRLNSQPETGAVPVVRPGDHADPGRRPDAVPGHLDIRLPVT